MNLADHYFHTCVTCAICKGLDKVTVLDRKDFNRDIVESIDEAVLYLKQHLKVRYVFDGSPARREILKAGFLVPTIPEKPNSPKQKYVAVKELGNQ